MSDDFLKDVTRQTGIQGEWVKVRGTWDEKNGRYVMEESLDGKQWKPFSGKHNTVSVNYVGGPKDGQVEW